MADFNFTAARINALPPVDKDTWHKDITKGKAAKGLWLRQRKHGSLTWTFTGYIDGRTRKIPIGKWPDVTIKQARDTAVIYAGEIRKGIDPRTVIADEAEKRKKKAAKKQAKATLDQLTLRVAVDDYLEVRDLKQTTIDHYKKTFFINENSENNPSGLAKWLDKPLHQINRSMVEKWYRKRWKKSQSSAVVEARYLRSVFNLVIARDAKLLPEGNPVAILSGLKLLKKPKPRKRTIQPDQMKAFLNALLELKSDHGRYQQFDTARDYMLFLLLSGCRANEAVTLKPKHIDIKNRMFKLEDPKTEPIELPLNDALLSIVKRRLTTEGDYLFAGTDGTKPLTTPPKHALAAVVKASKVAFTAHDLRRTFRTNAERADLGMKTGAMLVNHKTDSVDLDYIQPTDEELLAASNKVAREILRQGEVKAHYLLCAEV